MKNEKNYSVLIINERGTYSTIAEGVNGILAGALAKRYRAAGVWVQIKED